VVDEKDEDNVEVFDGTATGGSVMGGIPRGSGDAGWGDGSEGSECSWTGGSLEPAAKLTCLVCVPVAPDAVLADGPS
jgi:hypothetical protein